MLYQWRGKGEGGEGLGRRQYTWVLCWTDSCTMGLIASSRSLIILIAVRAVLALRLRYSLSCSFENKYMNDNSAFGVRNNILPGASELSEICMALTKCEDFLSQSLN